MSETTTSLAVTAQPDAQLMESVLLSGDLSRLSPAQRVTYYMRTCESLGLNHLTKPFNYIQLNGKLTLYATKDAADQLRRRDEISIEKPDIQFQDEYIIITILARNKDGRTDSDVGVVKKTDMQGNFGNALMKAVTKAKRRVTLSICGLGFLDETEVESIPGAQPVVVTPEGHIAAEEPPQPGEEADDAPRPDRVLIDPMGPWAVEYAMKFWNCDRPQACRALAAKKLGKAIDKEDFIEVVKDMPKAE